MKPVEVIVPRGTKKLLRITTFADLIIDVRQAGDLKLNILRTSDVSNARITAKLARNAKMEVYFADFAKGSCHLFSEVRLRGQGADCQWQLATLAGEGNEKRYDVSFIHEGPHSRASMNNYGVARQGSRIFFGGVNHILSGAPGSKTKQSARIIVMDDASYGSASPTLRIDNDDVEASHAATVGQASDEHLFYLMSRGLSHAEAERLITTGYLLPIAQYFAPEDQTLIKQAIEEAIA